ncbi:MAG TPA: C40 family peptidase [Chthonomonadaceae bacterium]|nr:C40 family peptidase [Chthonomonadaceae bacterium]
MPTSPAAVPHAPASTVRPVRPIVARTASVCIVAAVCALALAAAPVRADGTLTLELPPSAAAVAQREAEHARTVANRIPEAPAPAPRAPKMRSVAARGGSRTFYSSRGQTGDGERVVGRLGQVGRATTIYRTQSTTSAHLSSVAAGTYLAIQADGGNWYGILMADGSLGWIRRQAVQVMDYQVISNGAPAQPAPSGDYGGWSDGLPSSKAAYFRGDPNQLFREAYKYLGVPYHWGGNTAAGIDCSAFVKNVFGACGYSLPRHSSDQTAYGLAVPKDQLQPGDRLYFGNASTRNITHTGLYLGNGYFIHASSNSHGVAVSHLGEALYMRMYICARR